MNNTISHNILEFYQTLQRDSNHRYRSWEHCYKFFRNNNPLLNESNLDVACLHLGFYLASWGMYRGSSKLLWKDYKIYQNIITELKANRYNHLWNLFQNEIDYDDQSIQNLFELKERLLGIFNNMMFLVNGESVSFQATDTLITKILMGTLGCTPAYDTYFKDGCRIIEINPYSNFSEQSFRALINFIEKNYDEFKFVSEEIEAKSSIRYPFMKLLDMYLWNIGANGE